MEEHKKGEYMHYEVVLINRETGEAMTTIAVSSNEAGAADVAWEYNSKRFGDDIDDYGLLMFTHDKELDKNPEEKLYADYFEVEDITERKAEERMQNSVDDKANVNWDGAEMVKVGVYKDSTGLYTETECNEDNWVELDFPKAIVEEWFWTTELHKYFPGYTMEKWLKEESSDEPELGNLIGFARQKGFELKRDDGIDFDTLCDFRKRFEEAVKGMDIESGKWNVYMDKNDESYRTCINIGTYGIYEDWDYFFNKLIEDIKENSEIKVLDMDIRLVHVDTFDSIKEKTVKTVMSKIGYSTDYAVYIRMHLGEAIDVVKHHGSLFDLDQILHLEDLLGITVSYDLYHYINGKLDDLVPMDLCLEDRVKLYTWVIEYVLGKE